MKKFYTIKQIGKIAAVSIRTLHYYDEIKLLKPACRTIHGHRRYTEDDLARLQQIIILKFLGFSLKHINEILHQSHQHLQEVIKLQANTINTEVIRIQKVAKFCNYLVNRCELQQQMDWSTMGKMIATLSHKNALLTVWHTNYLTRTEFQQVKPYLGKRTETWKNLFTEIKTNIDMAAESAVGVNLIKKLKNLVHEAYGDNLALIYKLWEGYKSGVVELKHIAHDKKVIEFISKVWKKI